MYGYDHGALLNFLPPPLPLSFLPPPSPASLLPSSPSSPSLLSLPPPFHCLPSSLLSLLSLLSLPPLPPSPLPLPPFFPPSLPPSLFQVLCSTAEDEPRYHQLLSGWVAEGLLPDFTTFSKESETKKRKRKKYYEQEAEGAKRMRLEEGSDSSEERVVR